MIIAKFNFFFCEIDVITVVVENCHVSSIFILISQLKVAKYVKKTHVNLKTYYAMSLI